MLGEDSHGCTRKRMFEEVTNLLPTTRKNLKAERTSLPRQPAPTANNCSDLLPSIFAEFLRSESAKPTANCLANHSISSAMRAKMIDWMVEIVSSFEMALETFFLSVKLMDFFLRRTKTCYADESVHMLGMACMLIAAKFEEVKPFTLKAMVETIGKNKFPAHTFLLAEKTILHEINYELSLVTPLTVLEFLCATLSLHHYVKRTAEVLLVINQMCLLVQEAAPSHQAVSALYLALTSLGYIDSAHLVLPFAHGRDVVSLASIMRGNVLAYQRERPSSLIGKSLRFRFLDQPGPLFAFLPEDAEATPTL